MSRFTCKTCEKPFNKKFNLDRHQEKCVSIDSFHYLQENVKKMKNEKFGYKTHIDLLTIQVLEQKQTIKELQDKLENVAVKRPTTSNKTQINNYIHNMKPVTDEHLLDNVQHLTIEHIKKGAEGYAEYALEYPLKDRLLCSDFS
jgi:phage shock protein A